MQTGNKTLTCTFSPLRPAVPLVWTFDGLQCAYLPIRGIRLPDGLITCHVPLWGLWLALAVEVTCVGGRVPKFPPELLASWIGWVGRVLSRRWSRRLVFLTFLRACVQVSMIYAGKIVLSTAPQRNSRPDPATPGVRRGIIRPARFGAPSPGTAAAPYRCRWRR